MFFSIQSEIDMNKCFKTMNRKCRSVENEILHFPCSLIISDPRMLYECSK